eukprot:541713-Hanusia_phi.AAC.1
MLTGGIQAEDAHALQDQDGEEQAIKRVWRACEVLPRIENFKHGRIWLLQRGSQLHARAAPGLGDTPLAEEKVVLINEDRVPRDRQQEDKLGKRWVEEGVAEAGL